MNNTEINRLRNSIVQIFSRFILVLSFVLVFTQNLSANEEGQLKDHFLKKIDKVVTVVQDSELSKCKRNDKIIEILEPIFDFELMAKLSLGKSWKKLKIDDKNKFVELYVQRMKKSYSSKLDSYNGEKIEVKKVDHPKNNRMVLITDLAGDKQKFEIVYKFYKPKYKKTNKDDWLIYDAEISGVSILKTDKAQFREFLKTKSISELMDALSKS